MLAHLGQWLVLLSLACAAAGGVVGIGAGVTRSALGWAWARRLAYGFGFGMTGATAVMEYALLTHDFSVRYVAQVGSLSSPTYITFVSLWSSLEGSILFWGFILGAYVMLATWWNGDENPGTMPWATGIWMLVGAFFCFLLAGPANPFLPIPDPVPTDGPGPNALLQNHLLMIVHPPFLYLGYVGMAIPFGIAVGALMTGRLEASQLIPLRRWLLVPWTFLTIGIVLGGWWAYEVLGWGGYWAWDPVENASLLPWLTATAALHAAMLPQRRGALKGWTITLVMASFILTLLGTFMTRSGVFNSVHAFSQSDIGPTILTFLAITLVFSVILLAVRVDKLEGEGAVTGLVSRETAFLVNNLLFVAFTFTVLVGTTYPLIVEAIKDTKLSVGEPYFNRMAIPIGIGILFLMGVGPALPWGQATAERGRELILPSIVSLAVAGVAGALGLGGPLLLVVYAFGTFAIWVSVKEMFAPAMAMARATRQSVGAVLPRAVLQSHRKVGAYVIHIGIVAIIVAIAVSSSRSVDRELRITKGTCETFFDWKLCYESAVTVRESNRTLEIANIRAERGDTVLYMKPALANYPRMGSPIGSPDVRSTPVSDLYLSLMNIDASGNVVGIHAFQKPLIMWLWLGTGLAALGALLALVPLHRLTVTSTSVVPANAEPTGK